jgi:hypothetical protein
MIRVIEEIPADIVLKAPKPFEILRFLYRILRFPGAIRGC